MANREQLKILKQGVKVWNNWRRKYPNRRINFSKADLWDAILVQADLHGADFENADLRVTDLKGANLKGAYLVGANLEGADLNGADLKNANLSGANLSRVDLQGANLKRADIRRANLLEANLFETNLSGADFGSTILGEIDLRKAFGLEEIVHFSPSFINTGTIQRSKGEIPTDFLRGCGFSDWEIESSRLYSPHLNNNEFIDIQNKIFDLRQRQSIQISSLFISYSHGDGEFVDKIEIYLNKKGVRFWRDVHDATAGRLEKQIDRAMRLNPTVLLILSSNSIRSDWVEHEVRTARQLEKDMGRDVLCPVALDDSWKTSSWPRRIMQQVTEYNILNFSAWKDDSKFENTFNKLIDGLELFYK